MEVHAHTHTPRKKWTHYFWEFLMLFLAVFCGFLAEYQLEHKIEQQRARQYIASLYEDLKIDNKQLEDLIPGFKDQDRRLDTMLGLIKEVSEKTRANGLYKYHFEPAGYADFIYTDRTIQQLKNAGGMRLISNKKVSDSIIAYDAAVRLIDIVINEGIASPLQRVRQMNFELFDFRCCPELAWVINRRNISYPVPGELMTYDENKLVVYYNNVQNMRTLFSRLCVRLEELNVQNHRLRELLKKEYHLK